MLITNDIVSKLRPTKARILSAQPIQKLFDNALPEIIKDQRKGLGLGCIPNHLQAFPQFDLQTSCISRSDTDLINGAIVKPKKILKVLGRELRQEAHRRPGKLPQYQ
jgi:hypothetical protein